MGTYNLWRVVALARMPDTNPRLNSWRRCLILVSVALLLMILAAAVAKLLSIPSPIPQPFFLLVLLADASIIALCLWQIRRLRAKGAKTAAEIADVVERFLTNASRYPQEWSDFVECRHPDKQLDSYRKRCDELDPLVNCPGPQDPKALEELRNIVQVLRDAQLPTGPR